MEEDTTPPTRNDTLLLGGMRATRSSSMRFTELSYGPPWAHYLGGYLDRLLGGPLGLPGLCHTAPDGMRRTDYGGEVYSDRKLYMPCNV
jgi:hypothetical protein